MTLTRFSMLPVISLLIAATLWGIFWYPLRLLDTAGIDGLWTTFIAYGAALVVALPFIWRRRNALKADLPYLVMLGLASGWCNMAFILAMIDGTIVRVILLFYLSPLWTVLLGYFILGERISYTSALTLTLAMMGALMMLWSPELGFPWPESRADWLAISSGAAFALANVLVRKGESVDIVLKMVSAWWGAVVLAGAWLMLIQSPTPEASDLAWVACIGFGLFWLVAATLAVQYGVTHMPVQRSAVILLFELVVGAVSALLLTNETILLMEWLGGGFILLAAWMMARPQQVPNISTPEARP